MQADRLKLLQLLTGYELAVTAHEGYAKVSPTELLSLQALPSVHPSESGSES